MLVRHAPRTREGRLIKRAVLVVTDGFPVGDTVSAPRHRTRQRCRRQYLCGNASLLFTSVAGGFAKSAADTVGCQWLWQN